MPIIYAGSTALPDPVSISIDDEIIWSEDTGRTLAGLMVGDAIAQKKKVSIKWGPLQESEMTLIKNNLVSGFFSFTMRDDSSNVTITGYRGTLSKEQIGYLGNVFWYRSASVNLIQQ